MDSTTKNAREALIFDIGRVIVRVDVRRGLAELGGSDRLPAEEVWATIQADPRWRDWQEGRIAPRDWHAGLARRLGFRQSFEEFCAAWNSALDPRTNLRDELFARLATRYRLVLLSNTDPIHVAHIESRFRFPRYFPVRIYSCQVGASKPDPVIYRRAVRAAGVPAHRALYIDDAREYVAAGRRAGLRAVQFRSPRQLLGELQRRGVL